MYYACCMPLRLCKLREREGKRVGREGKTRKKRPRVSKDSFSPSQASPRSTEEKEILQAVEWMPKQTVRNTMPVRVRYVSLSLSLWVLSLRGKLWSSVGPHTDTTCHCRSFFPWRVRSFSLSLPHSKRRETSPASDTARTNLCSFPSALSLIRFGLFSLCSLVTSIFSLPVFPLSLGADYLASFPETLRRKAERERETDVQTQRERPSTHSFPYTGPHIHPTRMAPRALRFSCTREGRPVDLSGYLRRAPRSF